MRDRQQNTNHRKAKRLNKIKKLTCIVCPVGATVVGRFGDHVGKVDALAEHVAGHRRLRRRNPQALVR